MTASTVGLILGEIFAGEISQAIFSTTDRTDLVRASVRRPLGADELRAADVALPRRAALDLVRDRERRERPDHRSAPTILLVVTFHEGALGVIVGNFLGTLTVYLGLLAYRREQLGLQFDWPLFKRMEHFGLPLLPSALALWAINFSDRFFLDAFRGHR